MKYFTKPLKLLEEAKLEELEELGLSGAQLVSSYRPVFLCPTYPTY